MQSRPHFHSTMTPRNFGRVFLSPVPGFVIGIGETLLPYDESDTFPSRRRRYMTDDKKDAHIHEFGGQDRILVVHDTDGTDMTRYSLDLGNIWYVDLYAPTIDLS